MAGKRARSEGGGGPVRGGASELPNTIVVIYGGHKLEKDYKEGYIPLIWPSPDSRRIRLKSPWLPGQGINPRSLGVAPFDESIPLVVVH